MKIIVSTALAVGVIAGPSLAQSAQDGEKIFKKCAACHKVGPDAKNSVGPVLDGVIGRTAGTFENYKYSKSMKAAGAAGLVWSEETVLDYLADPTKYLRTVLDDPRAKAKMKFKLKSENDRRAIIAYLSTFSTATMQVPQDGFCVVNTSEKPHFFTAETREGERVVSNLKPGEQLCSSSTAASDGIVSVFETENGFEGCSRIIPVGQAEEMQKFAEFDRCRWGSHNS